MKAKNLNELVKKQSEINENQLFIRAEDVLDPNANCNRGRSEKRSFSSLEEEIDGEGSVFVKRNKERKSFSRNRTYRRK